MCLVMAARGVREIFTLYHPLWYLIHDVVRASPMREKKNNQSIFFSICLTLKLPTLVPLPPHQYMCEESVQSSLSLLPTTSHMPLSTLWHLASTFTVGVQSSLQSTLYAPCLRSSLPFRDYVIIPGAPKFASGDPSSP